jgi:hypothetical protein
MRAVRAVLAVLLYAAAAFGGLAVGYYATAPGSLGERVRAREEQRVYEQRLAEEFAEMEAAATFLEREEQRSAARVSRPASADL